MIYMRLVGVLLSVASMQTMARDLGEPVGTVYDATVVQEVRFAQEKVSIRKPVSMKLSLGQCQLEVSIATSLAEKTFSTVFGRTEKITCSDTDKPVAIRGSVMGNSSLAKGEGVISAGSRMRVSIWETQTDKTMKELASVVAPILDKAKQRALKAPTEDNIAAERLVKRAALEIADSYAREMENERNEAEQ